MKALVLLSGGIDSTTCLALAIHRYGALNVRAISVDYKQRHVKEVFQARKICDHFGVHWTLVKGPQNLVSMLNDPDAEVPDVSYDDLGEGVSPTYVPFRNGQLLSLMAAEAQMWSDALHAERPTNTDHSNIVIFFGAHAEDAHNWAYPDCTPEFVGAMANAIYVGTYHKVRLEAPFQYSKKAQIIRALEGVPYELTWSCYKGEELHCGTCPTCRARKEAFEQAEIDDPTEYVKG